MTENAAPVTWMLPAEPTEPEDKTVVLDGQGLAWQRRGNRWLRCGTLVGLLGNTADGSSKSWRDLWFHEGPLTLLRPVTWMLPADASMLSRQDVELAEDNSRLRRDLKAAKEGLRSSDAADMNAVTNDLASARRVIERFRGTPSVRESARNVVMSSSDKLPAAREALRRALNIADQDLEN